LSFGAARLCPHAAPGAPYGAAVPGSLVAFQMYLMVGFPFLKEKLP
jgi:hypothetical protein